MAKRTAVIDLGSNSVRMVIFEKTSRYGFHLLHEEKSRVRISEAAYENDGQLQPKAMERTIAALANFASITQAFKVRKTLFVATSAIRDANNRQEFIKMVKEETGLQIKVISGEKEAYLGALACANLLKVKKSVTIDIGGGSTECACIQEDTIMHNFSLKLGTVRLKELYFDRGDIVGAQACIDAQIATLPPHDGCDVIGIGGTFRAIAKSLMKRTNYPLNKIHGFSCESNIFLDYIDQILRAADDNELRALGIKKDRLDVIRPGALILRSLLKHFEAHTLISSGVGVREGVYLQDLLRSNSGRFPHNFNPSVRYLLDSYQNEEKQSNRLGIVSATLFDLLHESLGLKEKHKSTLVTASKLTVLGSNLYFYAQQEYAYYLLKATLEYGFTHKEIMSIATLVRYQNKKRPAKSHREKYAQILPKDLVLENLSFLLLLSRKLLSHYPRNIDFDLKFDADTLYVSAKAAPLYLAREQIALLELPEGINIVFN